MGAVRNSNTRASHASVEVSGGQHASANNAAPSAPGAITAAGSANADSPHLNPDTPDRRPSFSYLRRASDRRRRRRMLERGIEEPDLINSPNSRQQSNWREFVYPGPSSQQHQPGSRDSWQRDTDLDNNNQRQPLHEHRSALRRSDQIDDDEAERLYEGPESSERALRQDPRQQQQTTQDEQQRRQSINVDRLTDAVSDVMEFVREESFRRGKRRSLAKRRFGGGGSNVGAGSSGGTQTMTDDADFDSEDVNNITGYSDKSPNYRRRRTIMRRSPRRSAAAAAARVYNDSDTGSGASISHEPSAARMMMAGPQHQSPHHHHQAMRYKLQHLGGSAQDAHLMDCGGLAGPRGTALLIEQHRRHQSADACSGQQQMPYIPVSGPSTRMMAHEQPVIRPIPVGASPPPLIGVSAEAELLAARRKRDEEESMPIDEHNAEERETAIRDRDDDDVALSQKFIAPKVAELGSPSALLIPDEEIAPPNVPFRGRRLPQIPGLDMIKTAADFLHSSFYGRAATIDESMSIAAATSAVAATPLVVAGAGTNPRFTTSASIAGVAPGPGMPFVETIGDEPVFPSVSESPTIKEPGHHHVIGIKKGSTPVIPIDESSAAGVMGPSALLCSDSSINFPRVSFSPTHSQTTSGAVMTGSTTAPKYHPLGGTSMIATQASDGTQSSTVLASTSVPGSDPLVGLSGAGNVSLSDRGSRAWPRNRRTKKDDEDDWF